MPGARRRVGFLVLVALAVAVGWYIPRVLFLADTRAEALAYTECPWRSAARVTLTDRVTPEDSVPVLAHERVHAAQCDELGPLRYRWRNLTARGRMSLEAPAYCAGARARLRLGLSARRVRERLLDDAISAFHGRLEPGTIRAALATACPDIVGATFVGRDPPSDWTRQFPGAALVILS
jgi:hypothetical protein